MTKAFRCDRCGKYNEGSGNDIRIGKRMGFSNHFNWELEICDDCKETLYDAIEGVLGND